MITEDLPSADGGSGFRVPTRYRLPQYPLSTNNLDDTRHDPFVHPCLQTGTGMCEVLNTHTDIPSPPPRSDHFPLNFRRVTHLTTLHRTTLVPRPSSSPLSVVPVRYPQCTPNPRPFRLESMEILLRTRDSYLMSDIIRDGGEVLSLRLGQSATV